MKILKFFDLYADNVHLYLNERSKIKTEFGGFLTITMLLVIGNFSWLIGKDLYYKNNPFYYQQGLILSDYQEININPEEFPLAMSFQDVNGNVFYDDRYLRLQIAYFQYFINTEGIFEYNKTLLEYEKCNYTHFPTQTKENFDKLSINNYFCIKQPYNINLKGYWSESKVNYLQVAAVICKDEIPGYCKNKTEVEKYIGDRGLNLNLYFIDYELSISNFTNPFRQFFVNTYKFITTETKYTTYMIETDKLSTDEGLMFDNWFDKNFLRCVELQNDVSIFSDDIGNYINYEFYSSNRSTISNRKYIKISEIIASAGGLYNVFSIVFYYINLPFCTIIKNKNIVENLFGFSENKKITNNSVTIFPLNSVNNTNIHLGPLNKNKKIKDKIESAINKEKLNFSIGDYFLIIIRKLNKIGLTKRKNINIYEQGAMYIQNKFDLENIFKILIEYQFLKKLIFKEHQRYFLSKLKISFEQDSLYDSKITTRYDENDENYISILNSECQSEIDSKLIELILK